MLRAAIRQLERADIYLAAVAYMDIDDRDVRRTVNRLRTDVESLRRYLNDLRAATSDSSKPSRGAGPARSGIRT